ncbi:MAG: diguanylate cyclase [Candidatus Eremiobacteraeota bacterium]|nr:diguanylate cyclase [Candidatus Eremiobacteraeota bacterium]
MIVDGDVTDASLTTGATIERGGSRLTFGSAPVGHGVPSFPIAPSAGPARLCVQGRDLRISTLSDTHSFREALGAGRLSGFYLGIIAAIGLLQIMLIGITRERASVYYFLFLISLLGVEAVREGATIPHLGQLAAYVLTDSACAFTITAFLIEFLNLRRAAPRLYWILVLSIVGLVLNAIAGIASPAIAAHLPGMLLVSNAAGMLLFISISVIRGRAGYRPAYYLLAGLGGLAVQNWYLLLRDWLTFSTPFVDRWAFEMSSALDAVMFLLAILLRMRYIRFERERVELELRDATYAADHDPLTRLLNRRGLDRALATMPPLARTVFFVDLDNFKTVNDRGGHHLGDLPLIAVAAILDNLARNTDVAARIGGDEFVLTIATTNVVRVAEIVASIQERVSALRPIDGDTLRIGASVGTAPLAPRGSLQEALLRADLLAYDMKVEHYRAAGDTTAEPAKDARSSRFILHRP